MILFQQHRLRICPRKVAFTRLRMLILAMLLATSCFITTRVAIAESVSPDESERELHFPDEPPPEPLGYKMNAYRSLVPLTLKGAEVVSDEQAMTLYRAGQVLFIDVMPFVPRPPNLPEGMIWRDKKHSHIKGSVWLPNVGYGRLPKEMDDFFRAHLKRLTGDNSSKPLLFYCQKNCWMSWNAAKRAMEYGYFSVYWYPDGTDGWVTVGGELVAAKPLPLPDMTRALKPVGGKK